MDVDDSGWRDLGERLAASAHGPTDLDLLINHLTEGLVSHFGADLVECWLGKDGARRHSMREVAAASVAHLRPVIDALPTANLAELTQPGAMGDPIPPPWDDHWRSNPRTAGWRS